MASKIRVGRLDIPSLTSSTSEENNGSRASLGPTPEATLVSSPLPLSATGYSLTPKPGSFSNVSRHHKVLSKYPVPGKGEHWKNCHTIVQKHDESLCGMWKDEVDKLLIFAGLFSAAVTAFVIESYQWLQPNPADLTNQLLAQISLQLGGTNALGNNPLPSLAQSSGANERWITAAERINIVWFLSLTLGLATVLIGILCLQWLREYGRDAALPHSDSIALRQMRFEGLLTWRVPSILASLPLILQTALILFFVGILDLLWALDRLVAVPITVAVGILSVFLFTTTVFPTLQLLSSKYSQFHVAQCAYKSPQSWILYRFTLLTLKSLKPLCRIFRKADFLPPRLAQFVECRNWNHYDSLWQKNRHERGSRDFSANHQFHQTQKDDLSAGIEWIARNFNQNVDVVHALHHCLQDVHLSTAARVVGALDSRVENQLSWMLRPQKLRSYTGEVRWLQPHSEFKRDLIMAYFHEMHKPTHPESSVYQLEHVIRLMGSPEHWKLRPYLEWPIQDISDYPEELALEFLDRLITAFRNSNTFTRCEIIGIWKIIQDISRSLNERDRPSGATKVSLVSALIDHLSLWLTSPSVHVNLNRAERVRLCVQGLIDLFFPWPSMTIRLLRAFHPDISVVYKMIECLDEQLSSLDLVENTPVLDPSHRDGWLSLKRQLESERENDVL